MRWTQTFIPTLKETPAEAEILSHRLLLRAGLIRKLTSGLYTFLPLGLRALQKIESIIREEMDRAGAIEVLMPSLQPPEIWQQSGRYETAQNVFFKAHDRTKREWILGPTHEEVITTLVAGEINSYRQLPVNFYQIQTKFRDEIRPRFGLMRAREFVMKDAYSFDVSDEAASASYQKMYDAYVRIFQRCGLRALPVEADTGVMGGKHSHEFMVPAEVGESDIVYNASGTYAANIEKASSSLKSPFADGETPTNLKTVEKFETPGVKTIEALEKGPYNVPAQQQIKTLIYIVEDKPVLLLLLGSDQLNEAKLAGVVGATTFRPATPDEIYQTFGAHPGSLGGVGVSGPKIYADHMLRAGHGLTTGANEDGFHIRNVSIDRDIQVDQWADLRTVQKREPCPQTGEPLEIRAAIEVGHVFKLGTKYSEDIGALFLDDQGKHQPAVMGCYGIGVTRTLQAVIEQDHDDAGIVWPLGVAPYQVCITGLDVTPDSPTMQLAESLYQELTTRNIDVILDDRDERPGVKFKDSELIGFPLRIGIGPRSLKDNVVELKPRTSELQKMAPESAIDAVTTWIEDQQN
ncbi:MAG: Proline--tRNA ligase [Verrucomicrobia subdivision 3 bacterium]|nr:Proline--tRNA ligase [Limisphaerales bacterium]MCS1417103.1 Proline--tRNA ligase [Limisphaerales bacterium]